MPPRHPKHPLGLLNNESSRHDEMTSGIPLIRRSNGILRILVHNGSWWISDERSNLLVRIDPHFAKCSWNVGLLSESLGLGKRTFARIVEHSLGITGKVWLRQIRIVAALHLLREGDKIENTARKLGFRHPSDFTREFRILVGVLPSDYVESERLRSLQTYSE